MPDITTQRLGGGFCVVWWEGPNRRRFRLKARTQKEAESEARDVYLKETRGPAGPTVADVWEGYRHHIAGKPTAETMRWTGKAILPHFGALRPDQITTEDCRGYTALRTGQGKSVGTIHTELGHLRSAVKWAQKHRLITAAPHIERPPKPDSSVDALTRDQVRRLLDGCSAPHIRLAVLLLLTTAGRVGAILDLTWDRVDFERGHINLRLPDSTNRKGRANVPMNRTARAALTAAHGARLTDFVVEASAGQTKPLRSIKTGYYAAAKRAGLTATIHQLRHTAAVEMLLAGTDIERVSQYLGHSNVQITRSTYARFLPDHLADAAAALEFGEIAVRR